MTLSLPWVAGVVEAVGAGGEDEEEAATAVVGAGAVDTGAAKAAAVCLLVWAVAATLVLLQARAPASTRMLATFSCPVELRLKRGTALEVTCRCKVEVPPGPTVLAMVAMCALLEALARPMPEAACTLLAARLCPRRVATFLSARTLRLRRVALATFVS